MSDAELIARLRDAVSGEHDMTPHGADVLQAADRIEALIAERDDAEHLARMRKAFIEEARDERDALTAKLARAVEAFDMLVRDCEADYPPSHGAIKHFARATIAELKGESHE
jgi:hypothetical protein